MEEVFPVLAGVAIGMAVHRIGPVWLRVAVVGVLGLAFGVLASWISGELAISWIYVLIDTTQVVVAAVMTSVLVKVWSRRVARRIAR
jgi:hypothetical protein